MGSHGRSGYGPGGVAAPSIVRVVDVTAKLALLVFVARVLADPTFGNLEGKAPTARAVTYPLVAVAVPVWWWIRGSGRRYPWTADLLLTLVGFSDILGNRLDLFDQVVWFDDGMHVCNTFLVSAAALLLAPGRTTTLEAVLERAVAVGMTVSLGWEVFEYFSFVTRSPELRWAYSDTLGDLVLGWLGAAAAGLVVHAGRRLQPVGAAVARPVREPQS